MMRGAKRGGSRGRSPLGLLIAIAAIAVVVLFASAAFEILDTARGYSFEYDVRDYLYNAESGHYGELYETAVRDMEADASYSDEVAEYRALAFYYEQAVLEHAYREVGDEAKADAFEGRMREYEGQLGSMAPKAADVRAAVSG